MTRRNFIRLTSLFTVYLILTLFSCTFKKDNINYFFYYSTVLWTIFNKKDIIKLGNLYLKSMNSLNTTKKLKKLISDNSEFISGTILKKKIESKIIEDFKTNNFEVIDGWVLSKTEFQQCALFALTQKS